MLDRSRQIEADVHLPFFNRGDNLEIEEEEKNDVDHVVMGIIWDTTRRLKESWVESVSPG